MATPTFSVGVDADPMLVEQTIDKTLDQIIKERRESKGTDSRAKFICVIEYRQLKVVSLGRVTNAPFPYSLRYLTTETGRYAYFSVVSSYSVPAGVSQRSE